MKWEPNKMCLKILYYIVLAVELTNLAFLQTLKLWRAFIFLVFVDFHRSSQDYESMLVKIFPRQRLDLNKIYISKTCRPACAARDICKFYG